jgi:hypothetical protein
MISQDPFSQSYAELLSGTYDVVDRLVLNAYFPAGQPRKPLAGVG